LNFNRKSKGFFYISACIELCLRKHMSDCDKLSFEQLTVKEHRHV